MNSLRYQVLRIWRGELKFYWEVVDSLDGDRRLNACRTRDEARKWAAKCNEQFRRYGEPAKAAWGDLVGMVVKKNDGNLAVE